MSDPRANSSRHVRSNSGGRMPDEITPLIRRAVTQGVDSDESSDSPMSSTFSHFGHANSSPPASSPSGNVQVDPDILNTRRKWKKLTEIEDNSTAKDMATEVQKAYQEQKLRHQSNSQQGKPASESSSVDSQGRRRPKLIHAPSFRIGGQEFANPVVQNAVDDSDLEHDQYIIAASFIRDGVHGRKIGYRLDRQALFLNQFFHSDSYHMIYALAVLVASSLAFVERPPMGKLDATLGVEIGCLLLFASDLAIRWLMSSKETRSKYRSREPWAFVKAQMLLATVIDLALNLAIPTWNPYRYTRALRPFFFIARRRNVRVIFGSCIRALRKVLIVLLLLLSLIMFFGLVGYMLFSSDVGIDGQVSPHFASVGSSMYTMLLVHTCPPRLVQTMYPYFVNSHWSALYFIVFIMLTNLFLAKLTIAVSYKSYKQHTEHMLYKRLQKRKAALFAAFDILSDNPQQEAFVRNSSGRSSRTLRRGSSRFYGRTVSFDPQTQSHDAPVPMQKKRLSLESWIAVCVHLQPMWSSTDAELVFNTVDLEHVGSVDLADFFQLCSLLSVKVERTHRDRLTPFSFCFSMPTRQSIERSRVKLRDTLLYEVRLCGNHRVVLAELFVGALICLSVVQAVQVNNIELAFAQNRSWRIVGVCLLSIFTTEVVLKLIAFGRSEFFGRPFCKLDLAIVSVGWVFYAITSTDDPPEISTTFYNLALAVRSLRIIKLLNLFPPFHEILWTMQRIMPLMAQLLIVVFSVIYAFAIVGQANYGSLLQHYPPEYRYMSPNWYDVRAEFQLDSFDSTLVTLFSVAVLAGWDIVMNAAHAMTGSNATYVFFFTYRLSISTILLPIVVGFLVESFSSSAKSIEQAANAYDPPQVDPQNEQMAVLASKQPSVDDLVEGVTHGNEYEARVEEGEQAEPVPDDEFRIRFQRRGSLVQHEIFDSAKLSDASKLKVILERRDEEIEEKEMEIRRLEGNVLGMQNRVRHAQQKILSYEEKLEELSAELQRSREETMRERRVSENIQSQLDGSQYDEEGNIVRRKGRPRGGSWFPWNL